MQVYLYNISGSNIVWWVFTKKITAC